MQVLAHLGSHTQIFKQRQRVQPRQLETSGRRHLDARKRMASNGLSSNGHAVPDKGITQRDSGVKGWIMDRQNLAHAGIVRRQRAPDPQFPRSLLAIDLDFFRTPGLDQIVDLIEL